MRRRCTDVEARVLGQRAGLPSSRLLRFDLWRSTLHEHSGAERAASSSASTGAGVTSGRRRGVDAPRSRAGAEAQGRAAPPLDGRGPVGHADDRTHWPRPRGGARLPSSRCPARTSSTSGSTRTPRRSRCSARSPARSRRERSPIRSSSSSTSPSSRSAAAPTRSGAPSPRGHRGRRRRDRPRGEVDLPRARAARLLPDPRPQPARPRLKRYVRDLERAIIQRSRRSGSPATRIEGLTGVWIRPPRPRRRGRSRRSACTPRAG